VDALDLLLLPARPLKATCHVARDLSQVTTRGKEVQPTEVAATPEGVCAVWESIEAMYRTRLFPAIQLCVRRHGEVVMHRALGYAAGSGPEDPLDAELVPVTLDTPFLLYSASKAVTAMVIHKLDEERRLHLDDRISDYIPEFSGHGKQWITIRHVLGHRAGIPNLPPGAMDPAMLERPERIIELLCAARPRFRPGRRLAYHAVTGGFLLGEVVRRATGHDIRRVLRDEIAEPLGLHWLSYGLRAEEIDRRAHDAVTGYPVLPPFSGLFRRALGTGFRDAVRIASDPRFLTGIVPSANVVCTADELCSFYQCLLDEGKLGSAQVFDPRTVRHATSEQTYWDLDLTMGVPVRYGLGFVLGGETASLFGSRAPRAFGHLGFTSIFSWADPDRRLAVALLSSGKTFLSLDVVRIFQVIRRIGRAFPPV
jgi:CubicO group peptidase (beta-lactamase class C family)